MPRRILTLVKRSIWGMAKISRPEAKVKAMPEDRQVEIAELLEHVVSTSDEVYVLTDEEERLVQEALDNPSPPASKEQVRAVFDKYR